MNYPIFDKLLTEKNITFKKEVLLKDLMQNATDFKHKFRCDYVIEHPNQFHKLIIEIEGGTFINGRHNSGIGSWNDILKYNAIIFAGYPIIRFSATMLKNNPFQIVELIDKYINHTLSTTELSVFIEKHKKKQKKRKP